MMKTLRLALPYLFLILLTGLTLDLANPLFDKPARDGGFFMYAGSQILDGKIPYRDVWDSKGPAIFYINALGLWLGGGSRWGVWFVEFACILGMFALLYRYISNRWGIGAALFGTTLAGLGLRVTLGGGNYTEEYALLFNAAGVVLFLSMADAERGYLKYAWIGALFGVSFTFRANNIGGLFAIVSAVFLFHAFKRNMLEALRIAFAALAGFLLPLFAWTVYFALLGAVDDMYYASILFNFSYSAAQDREWLDLFGGFGRYGMGWAGWFTLFAWAVVFIQALAGFAQKRLKVFEVFLLLWFPIEILLSNLSGRNFTHYYISWALAAAVYSAYVFALGWQAVFKIPAREGWSEGFGSIMATAAIAALLVAFPSAWARYGEAIRVEEKEFANPLSAYIQDNTSPADLVLTWYPEMRLNFMADRTSPVTHVYYPLFLEGSLTDEIETSYISDLTSTPPTLIVDCSRSVDAIPSLDPLTRDEQYSTPGLRRKMYIQPRMEEIFQFVEQNYHIETTIEGCIIFRLNQ